MTDSLEQQLSWYPPDISPGEVEIPVGTSILCMGDGRWKPLRELDYLDPHLFIKDRDS